MKIKMGVVGLGRGLSFINSSDAAADIEITAICDIRERELEKAGKEFRVATYTDYDKFLEHDMDAVALANYFNDHASFAIKALRAGKHVMSETSCNATLAEGVTLCREVEKSGKIYMLAENYPFTAFNLEMKRLYETGELGEVTYADGEYNHPVDPETMMKLAPGFNHWRNWMPPTYYCTHALAPLVYMTGRIPRKVNALSINNPVINARDTHVADCGDVILCRMDNGAVFRIFGLMLPGHTNWYRLLGTRGGMEIQRGPGYFGPGQVRVWHDEWDMGGAKTRERLYMPEWPSEGKMAASAGHGGGDWWVNRMFAQAIEKNEQPFFDVYRGVTLSSVGILAWKSALAGGHPFDVPDFTCENERKAVENDHWSPFPGSPDACRLPPGISEIRQIPDDVRENALRIWSGSDQ